MTLEQRDVRIYSLEIESGGPRETPSLICANDGTETSYEPVIFNYKRHVEDGILIQALVHAHVCHGCHSNFYLTDVSLEIDRKLLEKEIELGLTNPAVAT